MMLYYVLIISNLTDTSTISEYILGYNPFETKPDTVATTTRPRLDCGMIDGKISNYMYGTVFNTKLR